MFDCRASGAVSNVAFLALHQCPVLALTRPGRPAEGPRQVDPQAGVGHRPLPESDGASTAEDAPNSSLVSRLGRPSKETRYRD